MGRASAWPVHPPLSLPVSQPAPKTLLCHRNLLPDHIGGASVAERFRQCVPGSVVESGDEPRSWRVSHGRLRVEIDERGAPRAHVGRSVTLYISAVADQPPAVAAN